MNCTFTRIGETTRGVIYRCVTCGTTLPPLRSQPERIYRRCPAGGVESPPVLLRGEMILTAAQRWKLAGRPERTNEEVELLATQACQQCEQFRQGVCGLCGCPCRTVAQEQQDLIGLVVGQALRNKIRMATEDCPWKCLDCGHSRWQHVSGAGCDTFRGRP